MSTEQAGPALRRAAGVFYPAGNPAAKQAS